ncbi:hypothetical protein FFLO_00367 [Filobasidium floriforme]|uniref:Uncharacterized protein n=1 Tax=Filobasidium floriforme TaxID=5210 RepID=A0A8K0JS51_9TREE|nr:uncharacterized protein HD553DRAFT_338842 [Filobasidium floriforme]KAG7575377.1 hypothetical protein FFLO_00367 [Filobasidium floriforme]KAH8089533.1 hypothetical protein HD553DRAFT_338842 [Filobasidium floriforme]
MQEEDPGATPWEVPQEKSTEEILQETLKKEAAIQDVIGLQRRLKEIMDEIDRTEKTNDKLEKENEMLHVYENNL